MGNVDAALDWLDRSWEAGEWQLSFLAVEPIFESLYGEARFIDLLRRLDLPTEPPGDIPATL